MSISKQDFFKEAEAHEILGVGRMSHTQESVAASLAGILATETNSLNAQKAVLAAGILLNSLIDGEGWREAAAREAVSALEEHYQDQPSLLAALDKYRGSLDDGIAMSRPDLQGVMDVARVGAASAPIAAPYLRLGSQIGADENGPSDFSAESEEGRRGNPVRMAIVLGGVGLLAVVGLVMAAVMALDLNKVEMKEAPKRASSGQKADPTVKLDNVPQIQAPWADTGNKNSVAPFNRAATIKSELPRGVLLELGTIAVSKELPTRFSGTDEGVTIGLDYSKGASQNIRSVTFNVKPSDYVPQENAYLVKDTMVTYKAKGGDVSVKTPMCISPETMNQLHARYPGFKASALKTPPKDLGKAGLCKPKQP